MTPDQMNIVVALARKGLGLVSQSGDLALVAPCANAIQALCAHFQELEQAAQAPATPAVTTGGDR